MSQRVAIVSVSKDLTWCKIAAWKHNNVRPDAANKVGSRATAEMSGNFDMAI